MLTCRPRISNSEPPARFFASSEWTSSSLKSQGIETRLASQPRSAAVTTTPAPRISHCSRTARALARLAHAPALGEGERRTDQRQVREGLREVAELPAADGVVLLGEEPDVVSEV